MIFGTETKSLPGFDPRLNQSTLQNRSRSKGTVWSPRGPSSREGPHFFARRVGGRMIWIGASGAAGQRDRVCSRTAHPTVLEREVPFFARRLTENAWGKAPPYARSGNENVCQLAGVVIWACWGVWWGSTMRAGILGQVYRYGCAKRLFRSGTGTFFRTRHRKNEPVPVGNLSSSRIQGKPKRWRQRYCWI